MQVPATLSSLDARVKWIIIGLIAWVLLPWKGLEYGIFESTQSEIVEAYAWQSLNTSLLSLFSLIALWIRPWRSFSKALLIDAIVSVGTFILILFAANYAKESLGYSSAVQLIVLLGIFSLTLARMGFVQGDPFMTTAIVFVMASIIIF